MVWRSNNNHKTITSRGKTEQTESQERVRQLMHLFLISVDYACLIFLSGPVYYTHIYKTRQYKKARQDKRQDMTTQHSTRQETRQDKTRGRHDTTRQAEARQDKTQDKDKLETRQDKTRLV
jgi:hypothetical protein